MNKKVIFVLGLVVIFALLPVSGYCGYISMVIQTTVTASPEKIEVKITAQNNGDEPARVVYPELQLGSDEVKLAPLETMGVKVSHQWIHTFSSVEAGLKLYGTYPLLITLHYHDTNMYPSSMPEVVLFNLVKAGKGLPISSRIETTEVMDSGRISLTLGNTMDRAVAGSVRVFLPNELTTVNNPSLFELQPEQTSQVLFPVTNIGALPGSKYKIFAIMEFDESSSHYSVLASEMISVRGVRDEGSGRYMVIGGGGFIFLLFFLTVFLELRRREN